MRKCSKRRGAIRHVQPHVDSTFFAPTRRQGARVGGGLLISITTMTPYENGKIAEPLLRLQAASAWIDIADGVVIKQPPLPAFDAFDSKP